jgi:hypothetical protein
VAGLDASGAGAVLVTPAHQWPTGVVLAAARRLELIAWAARRGAVIIEDDYDAEFPLRQGAGGELQGLAPDHVVTLGTVSKSVAPALRLGWIVSPFTLADGLTRAKDLTDRGSSATPASTPSGQASACSATSWPRSRQASNGVEPVDPATDGSALQKMPTAQGSRTPDFDSSFAPAEVLRGRRTSSSSLPISGRQPA